MESYYKLKKIKSDFGSLLFDLEIVKDQCIKANNQENNLTIRLDKICSCIKTKSKPIEEKINSFKATNNLIDVDNTIIYSTLTKKIKPTETELEKFKNEYPLSSNEYWKYWFDNEYRRTDNYPNSYFYANEQLLFKEKPKIRDICLNHQTFNGELFSVESIISCIKKAKEIYKN